MEHGRHKSKPRAAPGQRGAFIRKAALATALTVAWAGTVAAQGRAPDSCAARIAAALTDIAKRDLDTSAGPPFNAFITLNPNAVAQAQACAKAS